MAVPVMRDGQEWGTRWMEQRGLYTIFTAKLRKTELCRLQAVYEQGSVWLGVPVPEQQTMVLRVSIPTSRLPGGALLRGQLFSKTRSWQSWPGGRIGDVVLPAGSRKEQCYRLPWKPGEPLPCEELLCFFRYTEGYLEIMLDDQGRPMEY